MIGHCIAGLPEEACGLLGGDPATNEVTYRYPAQNVAASAWVYTVDPLAHLRADRDAEVRGNAIVGVYHSHTHTDAYPSPTDVGRLRIRRGTTSSSRCRDSHPVVRSYAIVDEQVTEESVVLMGAGAVRAR